MPTMTALKSRATLRSSLLAFLGLVLTALFLNAAKTGSSCAGGPAASSRPVRQAMQVDLPGPGLQQPGAAACPARWQSIYLSHTPKAAGSAVRVGVILPELERLSPGIPSGARWCNKPHPKPNDTFPYNCLGHTPTKRAEAAAYVRANFGTHCEVLSSHWDTSLLESIEPDVLTSTLTATILRHPVDRIYSEYQWLQDIMRSNRTLEQFMWAFHGFTLSNHMTLYFAGELGCRVRGGSDVAGSVLPAGELLERAKRVLDSFCVVMIQERMDESAQLLRRAMRRGAPASSSSSSSSSSPSGLEQGQQQGGKQSVGQESVKHINGNNEHRKDPYVLPRDGEMYRRLAELNPLDMQLYEYALDRFERDLAAAAAEGGEGEGSQQLGSSGEGQGQQAGLGAEERRRLQARLV